MSFARYLVVLAAVSVELESFYINYHQYVSLIKTLSKDYGVGVHAQSGGTILF